MLHDYKRLLNKLAIGSTIYINCYTILITKKIEKIKFT